MHPAGQAGPPSPSSVSAPSACFGVPHPGPGTWSRRTASSRSSTGWRNPELERLLVQVHDIQTEVLPHQSARPTQRWGGGRRARGQWLRARRVSRPTACCGCPRGTPRLSPRRPPRLALERCSEGRPAGGRSTPRPGADRRSKTVLSDSGLGVIDGGFNDAYRCSCQAVSQKYFCPSVMQYRFIHPLNGYGRCVFSRWDASMAGPL